MQTEKRMIRKLPTGSTSEDGIWWEKHPTRRDIIEKIDEIIEALNTLLKEPCTADSVEEVHGRWVNPYMNRYGHPCHCCSICGFKASSQDKNYCPNCGAKMDGDGNG